MSRGKPSAPGASASMTRAQRVLAAQVQRNARLAAERIERTHGPLGSGPREPRPSSRAAVRRSTTLCGATKSTRPHAGHDEAVRTVSH